MFKLSKLFKKTILVAAVATLVLAALSITSAYASGINDPTVPPTTTSQPSNERLERVWARLQHVYER